MSFRPEIRVRTGVTLALAACLALGGCGKQEEPAQKAAAGGELLPRSVGDEMVPYDTVRSQASLASPDEAIDGGDMLAGETVRAPRASASEAAPEGAGEDSAVTE